MGLIALPVGLALGLAIGGWPFGTGAVNFLKLALPLALSGATGGLLASLATNDGLRLPRHNALPPAKLEFGFISDILFGVAGGLLLYVILPGTIPHTTPEEWLKLCGLALVLGFAGRGVVSSAAEQQIKQYKERADQLAVSVTQQNVNTEASGLLARFLEDPAQDKPESREKLAKAIKDASPDARSNLFSDTERFREDNWKQAARYTRGDTTADSRAAALLGRTAFVFKNLFEVDDPPTKHRVLASLGYTQYDLNQPTAAIASLSKAIDLGLQQHAPPHPFYHLALALAYLDEYLAGKAIDKNDPELKKKVQPNLDKAMQLEPYAKALVDNIKNAGTEADVAVYDRPLWRYLH